MGRSRDSFGQLQAEALQERVLWLEEELARTRRSLKALREGEAGAFRTEGLREEEGAEERGEGGRRGEEEMLLSAREEGVDNLLKERDEACFLAPLLPHEEVSMHWRLGEGLQEPRPRAAQGVGRSTPGLPLSGAQGESLLRLFGLLPSGQPWQCGIPFADLVRPGGVLLGRSPDEADVVLDESSVSRRHARLELDDQGLVITDEESTNGVCVGGCRLSPYERRAVLSDGMVVTIGEVVLRVEIITSPSSSTPHA